MSSSLAAAACSAFGLWSTFFISLQSDQAQEAMAANRANPAENVILPMYDFIVVGGGSAGNVVASRLSANPLWNVLLVERGPPATHFPDVPGMASTVAPENYYDYYTVPQRVACVRRCTAIRGRGLGGGSLINGMLYVRGSPANFDQWAAMGNDGWSYNDVLPFFIKSEDNHITYEFDPEYHGTGGPLGVSSSTWTPPWVQNFENAFIELGWEPLDYNGRKQQGVSHAQFTTRNGVRSTSYRAFTEPVLARPNLHVRTMRTVTKILFNSNKTAIGVEILEENGSTHVVRANNEVILSAGAIHSPQILMLSGIGPRDHLDSLGVNTLVDLPVGDNLMDHLGAISAVPYLLPEVSSTPLEDLVGNMTSWSNYNNRTGSMTSSRYQLLAFESYWGNPNISDLYYLPTPYIDNMGCSYGNGYPNPTVYNQIKIMTALLQPLSRGTVRLPDANPTSAPLIDPNYLSYPEEIDAFIHTFNRSIQLAQTVALTSSGYRLNTLQFPGCEGNDFGTYEYWRCILRISSMTDYHPVGTNQMAPRENGGVVDSRLRVYGVNKLRIVDASIMPIITSGNTNSPTIMIGEKGAHMIAEDWQTDYSF